MNDENGKNAPDSPSQKGLREGEHSEREQRSALNPHFHLSSPSPHTVVNEA